MRRAPTPTRTTRVLAATNRSAAYSHGDITLFRASNEYGGDEIVGSAYERSHCDAAGHRLFAAGVAAGALGIAGLAGGVVAIGRGQGRQQPPRAA